MGKVLPFKRPAAKKLGMCQHGFHSWAVDKRKQFDVKAGKLVTVYKCRRCGETKVEAH